MKRDKIQVLHDDNGKEFFRVTVPEAKRLNRKYTLVLDDELNGSDQIYIDKERNIIYAPKFLFEHIRNNKANGNYLLLPHNEDDEKLKLRL